MGGATREQLIEATLAVIETEGEQCVRLRDIAATVGVTEPLIYHHFSSRDALIEEAQAVLFGRDQMDVFATFIESVVASRSRDEFVEVVRSAGTAAMQPSRARLRLNRVNALGSTVGRPSLAARLMQQQHGANTAVGDALRVAQANGFVHPDIDCDALAVWVVGMVTGRVLVEIDPSEVDGEAWNRIAVDALLAATGNPPARLIDWSADHA